MMLQGEIWHCDLNPIKGSEQAGSRPVVIISGNAMNQNAKIRIVCPLTTQLKFYHGNVILKPSKSSGLTQESEVLTFHIRSVSEKRLMRKIGEIHPNELAQIHATINDILRY